MLIHIGSREGEYQNKPEKRIWIVSVHGSDKEVIVTCDEENAVVMVK